MTATDFRNLTARRTEAHLLNRFVDWLRFTFRTEEYSINRGWCDADRLRNLIGETEMNRRDAWLRETQERIAAGVVIKPARMVKIENINERSRLMRVTPGVDQHEAVIPTNVYDITRGTGQTADQAGRSAA